MEQHVQDNVGTPEEALAALQAENKALLLEQERLRFEGVLDQALYASNVRKTAMVKALLDVNALEVDENGQIQGLTEQLSQIKEEAPTLFYPERNGGRNVALEGLHPGNFRRKNPETMENPWAKGSLNLTKQAKLLKENPVLARRLKAQAGC